MQIKIDKWRQNKPGPNRSAHVRLLGDVSYPLCLVRIPVFIRAVRYGLHSEYLMTGLSILVAFALYYCVDLYRRRREMMVKVPVSQPAA